MSYFVKQSTAVLPLQFLLVQSSDHITPATGLTPTVTISKAGGSFTSPAGVVSEIANGWYQIAANATDSNTLGPLILHATASGADPTDSVFQIVAYDPSSGTNLGLTGLTTAAPGASGGMLTVGTGSGQISPDGTGAVPLAFGTALPTAPVANTVGEALFLADILGGRINIAQGGTTLTITLDASASSDTNAYVGDDIYLFGGTGGGVRGSGQRRTVTAYNTSTKVATVNRVWDTTPDNTTKFITLPQPLANVGIWNNSAVGVNLPVSGTLASTGAQMDLVNAPNTTAIAAIQNGLNTSGLVILSGTTSPATAGAYTSFGTLNGLPKYFNSTTGYTIYFSTTSNQWIIAASAPSAYVNVWIGQANINGAFNAAGPSVSGIATGVVYMVAPSLDMTQTVPTTNTSQTLGDALNAARADGFGKWVISGTTLTVYAADGTTAVRTFTLDSATSPTSRT